MKITRIDSNSSIMCLELICYPFMTVTDIGQCSVFNKILCVKAKSLSMKEELTLESRKAETKT